MRLASCVFLNPKIPYILHNLFFVTTALGIRFTLSDMGRAMEEFVRGEAGAIENKHLREYLEEHIH
jgi:hypothetical protein